MVFSAAVIGAVVDVGKWCGGISIIFESMMLTLLASGADVYVSVRVRVCIEEGGVIWLHYDNLIVELSNCLDADVRGIIWRYYTNLDDDADVSTTVRLSLGICVGVGGML